MLRYSIDEAHESSTERVRASSRLNNGNAFSCEDMAVQRQAGGGNVQAARGQSSEARLAGSAHDVAIT